MIATVLIAAVVLAQPAARTDTTFAVQPGGRLALEVFHGAATVHGWDRDAIRVQARHPASMRAVIRQRGGAVAIEADRRTPAAPARIEYDIMVPRSFSIHVDGLEVAVVMEGVNGSVSVSNTAGEIVVRRTTGRLDLESVSGRITVEDVRGNVNASTVNQGIHLTDVRGDVNASATNGSITLRRVAGMRVRASTINGEVHFDGPLPEGSQTYLGTHNGRVTLALAPDANASVRITSRQGQVEAAFPVPVSTVRDGRVAFTLGTGSAIVQVESYNGSVRLVRPAGR
jgi:hypothetical protein